MKSFVQGHDPLHRSDDFTELHLRGTAAYAVRESDGKTVRIVMIEKMPGGVELDMKLSPEDAAQFASTVYALARAAIIQNEREAEREAAMAEEDSSMYQAVAA